MMIRWNFSSPKLHFLFTSALIIVAFKIDETAYAYPVVLPYVCDDYYGVGREKTLKLAKIAIAEAKRKNIKLRRYKSLFLRIVPEKQKTDGMHVKKGPHFAMSFSEFQCTDEGLDGKSFTVKIDPATLTVMQSRINPQ